MAAGEYPAGLTLDYAAQEYWPAARRVRLVYPSEGSYVAPEGMFIIRGAMNMAAPNIAVGKAR